MAYVVAGGPVKNRGWILGSSIEAIWRNRPWALHYLWGDSNDNTESVLHTATDRAQTFKLPRITFEEHSTGFTGDPATRRGERDSTNLSAIRNKWLEQVERTWPDYSHLWVVDSDVIPDPNVLSRLLMVDKPVVGAYVPLADGVTPIHMVGWQTSLTDYGTARRTGVEYGRRSPHPVTLLGGCYLIERSAIEAGLRWGPHPQGEDGFFGDKCRELGIEMWVDPRARCEHRMSRPPQSSAGR